MCPAVCIACRYVLWAGLGLGLVLTRSKLELRDGDDMRAHLAAYAASVCGVIAIGARKVRSGYQRTGHVCTTHMDVRILSCAWHAHCM